MIRAAFSANVSVVANGNGYSPINDFALRQQDGSSLLIMEDLSRA